MTALVGWGATSGFQENWVYDGAHERYVADEEMRDKVRVALTKSRLPVLPIVQSNYSYTWP